MQETVFVVFAAQQQRGERRRQRERVEGGDGDGERDGQRELPVENAGGAGEERDRHEDGDEHQRSGDDGAGDLAHGGGGGVVRLAVALGDVALDVFDHDDGVVDDEAGGQRDAEQRERIDGEAEDADEGEGPDQRNRNGDGGDEGGAPVLQEEEDDQDDDDDGFDEGLDDFADGCADDGGGVEGDGVFHAGREGAGESVHLGFGIAIHLQGVGIAELLHAEADGGNAVEGQGAGVGFGAPSSAWPTSLIWTMPRACS